MKERFFGDPFRIGRRRLLAGAGAAAVAGSIGTFSLARSASALGLPSAKPMPSPIPGGIDTGEDVLGFIHWFLPGPEDAATPFAQIPGFGLDVEPSTLTNFKGFTAYSVISGQARGSDGKTYNVEFDIRVMEGEYIAEDGSRQQSTFGFF